MKSLYRLCSAILPAVLLATPVASAGAIEDFYRGKTVTILVSASAGGGIDAYARILQPYLSKYLPGTPTVIVRNMPGAGGIVAMNYLYNTAPRDGAMVGVVHNTVPFSPLLRRRAAKFKALEMNWLASLDRLPFLCIAWHASRIKKFDDLYSHQLVVGSTGAGSGMTTFPLLLNRMLGTKFKVVSGYKGGNNIYLAMERGEVEGRCSLTYPTLRKLHPEWLAQNKISIFAVLATERPANPPPALKDATFVYDLAKTPEQRAIFDLVFASGQMDRPMPTPPGVPRDRVSALSDAIAKSVRDPGLLADFEKRKLTMTYRSGEDLTRLIRKIYSTPAKTVDKAIEMMKAPKSMRKKK